jgi:hypothetical protein
MSRKGRNHNLGFVPKKQGYTMSSQAPVSQRFVGIRPRIKQTASGEARPTQVCILGQGDFKIVYDLDSEQAELDFVLGVFPTGWRKVNEGEDLSAFRAHHIQCDAEDKPIKVPSGFDGLKAGDIVSMVMGGSGDLFAFALSRKGEEIGAVVTRVTPFVFSNKRAASSKDDDASLLASLVMSEPGLFNSVYVRDRKIVLVRKCQQLRVDTMKARIGCEQRLRQRFIGKIFCSTEGLFPEGAIEKEFDEHKANDKVLQALIAEESAADKELAKAVKATEVWEEILSEVQGLGPAIAARLISVIQDVRRFETAPKLRKYLGVHVQADGRFPRRRAGELAGWSNEGRQALYLLIDQFNRRPDSVWGKKFLENKLMYQAKYPHPHLVFVHEGKEQVMALVPGTFEKKGSKYSVTIDDKVVEVTGKLRHFKGHIHKMTGWRTASQFVDWFFSEWWKLERRLAKPDIQTEGEKAA